MEKELALRGVSVALFVILTVLGMGFSIYIILKVHTFYMSILAILFLVLSAVSGFFNAFTSYCYYRSYLYDKHLKRIQERLKPLRGFPTVAMAVPVYNEDPSMVEKNLSRLMEMNYPKDRINYYLLDDSTDPKIQKELEAFSKRKKISYIHRTDRKGFKAGALNNFSMKAKEDFLAIFDYDEFLINNNFLIDLLPYFKNEKLCYVQTEKKFAKGTFFSDTVDIFHAFFFKFIQPSRALNNTAIFAGSCGLIKISCLKKMGGFPEYVTEDTFFSFESDANGYESLYIPKNYALGEPITQFTHLAKQQWRYNYGDTQFLSYFFRRISSSESKKPKSPLLIMDYVTHGFGLNYISGVLILFTLVSVLIVFSGLTIAPTFTIASILNGKDANLGFEVLGVSAFLLSLLTPMIVTKIYFKSLSKGFMMLILNFSLAFVRTKAAIMAMFSIKGHNSWTGASFFKSEKNMLFALKNSIVETAFSVGLFVLGVVALVINNLYGGIWLMSYSVFYISTVYMFYKYK
jgi:cellulose synthase/poly-beta-1,6-N-acetylglucosamine synthase-like glycosyltransferase